jgi:hypothetical protein
MPILRNAIEREAPDFPRAILEATLATVLEKRKSLNEVTISTGIIETQ